ncbi:MAG: flagellar motor switch protein FliM [Chloroflexi bacterium]|nr:flagellar motor switch protein FliM [Chloroflexota bacterium]
MSQEDYSAVPPAPQLSPAEIEALAQGQPGRRIPGAVTGRYPTVKEYDFRQPERLSKEQTRTLQLLQESFARLSGVAISGALRTNVQVSLTALEQTPYEGYTARSPDQAIFNIVRLDPLGGNMIIEFDLDLGFTMLDRLAGGTGMGPTALDHEVTDIELALLGRLTRSVLTAFRDAWVNVAELEPQLENTVLLPMFAQIALPSDIVSLATFEVHMGEATGQLRVCLPFSTLEPIVDNLNAQVWFSRSPRANQSDAEAQVTSSLGRVGVPVAVELGATRLTIRDLLDLRVGDVVRLDSRPDLPVELLVNGRVKYLGTPGRIRSRLAVKITASVPEAEEE